MPPFATEAYNLRQICLPVLQFDFMNKKLTMTKSSVKIFTAIELLPDLLFISFSLVFVCSVSGGVFGLFGAFCLFWGFLFVVFCLFV